MHEPCEIASGSATTKLCRIRCGATDSELCEARLSVPECSFWPAAHAVCKLCVRVVRPAVTRVSSDVSCHARPNRHPCCLPRLHVDACSADSGGDFGPSQHPQCGRTPTAEVHCDNGTALRGICLHAVLIVCRLQPTCGGPPRPERLYELNDSTATSLKTSGMSIYTSAKFFMHHPWPPPP